MALAAEMVLRACGTRTESRGPHLGFDSPDAAAPAPRPDPQWRRHLVVRRGPDGAMAVEPRTPVQPDWDLVQQIAD